MRLTQRPEDPKILIFDTVDHPLDSVFHRRIHNFLSYLVLFHLPAAGRSWGLRVLSEAGVKSFHLFSQLYFPELFHAAGAAKLLQGSRCFPELFHAAGAAKLLQGSRCFPELFHAAGAARLLQGRVPGKDQVKI